LELLGYGSAIDVISTGTAMNEPLKLRDWLVGTKVLQVAGVGDAGQARLVQEAGFPAVYISGAYVNHTRGYPDGVLTLSEIASRVREVAERVTIPVIADADEGFGGTLKIVRTVHEFERAGAAAIHLEDFATKKHGIPMSIDKMTNNLHAALDSRTDSRFVIIARTDAMAPWRNGVRTDRSACEEEAFERALAYCEAGADAVMPMYASNDWLAKYGNRVPRPLVVLGGAPKNWGDSKSVSSVPEFSADELANYNVRILIYATNMLSRSFAFMRQQYAGWLSEGRFDVRPQDELDRAAANALVGLAEKEELLRKYGE
jgi:2-methylisocitrate lyase-like PEP mutase family enzyme